MVHGEDLITLGLLVLMSYVLGRFGKSIGLPTIPIYMIVGLLASPYTGWFPIDFSGDSLEMLAIFGLILLLFSLGIEFEQEEFFGNAKKLILSGGIYVGLNMVAGVAFGWWLGWGWRETLVIAGITATSSSAIVTKLLIELRRLTNPETPMILGITVIEDVCIAVYLAIISVVLADVDTVWIAGAKLVLALTFLIIMFSAARRAGKLVSLLFRARDEELFTLLFFGCTLLLAGIGDVVGITDAIGAFLMGLILGATRLRRRVEQAAIPLRDVFGAFFFLNFGLRLDITTFGAVALPVLGAVCVTLVLNIIAGQSVAKLHGFGFREGINTAFILQNRGEFALILATLASTAGLDDRIKPFAGLYVLVMSVLGPLLAAHSEPIKLLYRKKRVA